MKIGLVSANFTGVNITGIEILALTASATEPLLITTSSPVVTSVAMTLNGVFKSLNICVA